jgi:hypothetical protein
MQVSNNPLLIEDASGTAASEVASGSILRRNLKVKNIGGAEEAALNFWLETSDSKSEPLLSWYVFDPTPPLRVRQGETSTVTLSFEVPAQARPDLYNYTVVFESAQYVGNFRRSLQLQVTSLQQDAELEAVPGFILEPATTSARPHLLPAGEIFKVVVQVENRSKLTDRFYLTCRELTKAWFTCQYPESAVESFGAVQATDGLQLNPKGKGEITLLIHPPPHTLAGNYFPTLQLTSRNNKSLTLLDVVYFQILPDDRLADLTLNPLLRRIPAEPGRFELRLRNQGNIHRHLIIRVSDQEQLFSYVLQTARVAIAPDQSAQIDLIAKPRKWWKRSLRGKDREFQFDVELSNAANAADSTLLETTYQPQLPSLPQGTIVWQSRPWWQVWLPLALFLALIGAIAFLLWPRSTPPPTVLAFDPSPTQTDPPRPEYQEGKQNQIPVRLDWKISHLEQISRVVVIRSAQGIETYRKSYFFNRAEDNDQSIPLHLQPQNNNQPQNDNQSQNNNQSQDGNNFCESTQEALDPPRLKLTLGTYPLLGLKLPYPYISRTSGNTEVLVCKGIYTPTQKAGDYTFQIQVFPIAPAEKPAPQTPMDTRTTDTVTVKAADNPEIIDFAATQMIYQEVGRTFGVASAGNSPPASDTSGNIRLNWSIANPNRVLALKLISVAPDGSAQGELKQYSLSNGTLPPDLASFCRLEPNLTCRNVPTAAQRPGGYVFKLVVVVRQEQGTTEITKDTLPITIKPRPIRITSFKVNDIEAAKQPRQVYLRSPWEDAFNINITWAIEAGADLQIELSPAPGRVDLVQSSLSYTLSVPGTETITLKATNSFGDQQSQSIVIQTIQVQLPTQPVPVPGAPPSGQVNGAVPLPSDPNQLPAIEAPPQPN